MCIIDKTDESVLHCGVSLTLVAVGRGHIRPEAAVTRWPRPLGLTGAGAVTIETIVTLTAAIAR